jgi:hypothetical protein
MTSDVAAPRSRASYGGSLFREALRAAATYEP